MLNSLDTQGRPQDTRVVVAMSGGVDSSVPPRCSRREGYDVVGVTCSSRPRRRHAPQGRLLRRPATSTTRVRVAERIGIPHYVLDYEARFKEAVIDRFAESYAAGETPVPCVECNRSIKFADLLGTARELGAQGAGDRTLCGQPSAGLTAAAPFIARTIRTAIELVLLAHHARAARCAALSARQPAEGACARACARVRARDRRQAGLTGRLLRGRGGHEADVLAVRLVGDGEAEPRGERARLGLGRPPSGKRRKSSCSRVVANRK